MVKEVKVKEKKIKIKGVTYNIVFNNSNNMTSDVKQKTKRRKNKQNKSKQNKQYNSNVRQNNEMYGSSISSAIPTFSRGSSLIDEINRQKDRLVAMSNKTQEQDIQGNTGTNNLLLEYLQNSKGNNAMSNNLISDGNMQNITRLNDNIEEMLEIAVQ